MPPETSILVGVKLGVIHYDGRLFNWKKTPTKIFGVLDKNEDEQITIEEWDNYIGIKVTFV